jgi:hypothetical protein
MTEMYDNLLSALGGAPNLRGAACRDQSQIFDVTDDPGLIESSKTICRTACPALTACRRWVDSLPAGSVNGVVAGELHTWTSRPSTRQPKRRAS